MSNLNQYFDQVRRTILILNNGKSVGEYIGEIANKFIRHLPKTKFEILFFMNAIYYAACDEIGGGIKTNGSCPKETILHVLGKDKNYKTSKTEVIFILGLPLKYRFLNSKDRYNYIVIVDSVTRRRKCMKLSPDPARGYYLAGTMLRQVLRNLTNKIGKK